MVNRFRCAIVAVFALLVVFTACVGVNRAKADTVFDHVTRIDQPASSVSVEWASTFEGLDLEDKLDFSVPFYQDDVMGWYMRIDWDLLSAKLLYDPDKTCSQTLVVQGKVIPDQGLECDDDLLNVSTVVTIAAKQSEKDSGLVSQTSSTVKQVRTITVNASNVTSGAISKAIAKACTSSAHADVTTVNTIVLGNKCKIIYPNAFKPFKGVVSVVVGKNVKKVRAKAFSSSGVKVVTLKTKKLTKKSTVKYAFRSSKVARVKIAVSAKASTSKKYAKKYKKAFVAKTIGKKLKVVAS